MKPIKLVISAFGPFKDEVTVEFEKLGGQGLFLVSGDTGSGKTTIFDAISFALFGSPSGEKRNEENNMALRSQYADKGTKTFVELTFLHKGKTYFIRRNPQYMRPSLRGNGETLEGQGAELCYPDGRKVVDFKKVTNAVEEILGINWAQYKQIAMIAQGEFLELLVADSDKRSAILRKIFGTGIYVSIQERLGTYTNRLKAECEEITNKIFQYFGDVQCPKDHPKYDSIKELLHNRSIHDTEKLIALISDIVKEKKEEHGQLLTQYKEFELSLAECSKRIAQMEQINSMFLTLDMAKEKEKLLSAKSLEMQEKTNQVEQGTVALQYIKPLEEAYVALFKEEESLHEKLLELKREEERLATTLTSLTKEKERQEKNKPRIEELAALLIKRREESEKYQQIQILEQDREQLSQAVFRLQTEIEGARLDKTKLEEDKLRNKDKLLELKDIEVKKATLEAALLQANSKLQAVKVLEKQFHQILADEEALTKEKNILLQKMGVYQDMNHTYNEAELLYIREQAGIMAAELKDDMPCPVCGSTNHPAKAPLTKGAHTKEQLKRQKEELEKVHEAVQKASESCSSKSNTLEYKKESFLQAIEPYSELKDLGLLVSSVDRIAKLITQVDGERLSLEQKVKETLQEIQRKNQLELMLQSLEEQLNHLQKSLEERETKSSTLKQQLSATEASLTAIKKEVSFASVHELKRIMEEEQKEYEALKRDLEEALAGYQTANEQLQRIQAVLLDNTAQQTKLKERREHAFLAYESECSKRGFGDFKAYQKALLPEDTLKQMTEEIMAYRDEQTKVKQSIEELTKALDKKERRDMTLDKEEEERLRREKEILAEKMEEIRFQTNQNVAILKKVATAYTEQKDKTDEFAVYERLSKTANGNLSGKAKIAFEQYVQAFYFDQILAAANDRLTVMTNSQYELKRKEEATNLRKNTGLDLEVLDHYSGKCRSVKTLSGGESFKAALSLALGLSDIIQRFAGGIQVDAMFVDEGFGSLDSNSLEQALSALNALTIGNRLVGIISHVNELKERIDKQILLEKNREGSTLTLVVS